MNQHIRRRLGATVGAAALAMTTLAVTATPVQAHPAGDRAVNAGASWLKGQLTDGIVHNEQYNFDDLGLSADLALALAAIGDDAGADAIVAAIEPVSETWVAGATSGRVYAGSLAKLVNVVQVTGRDATAFNGQDQVTRLEGLVATSAPIEGRLADAGVDPADPWDADFVNVIGQSFAARALDAAGSSKAPAATNFLVDQQCAAGFFRFGLTADKLSADQGCDASGDPAHTDTTALTLINLMADPTPSTGVSSSISEGIAWLKAQQAADGSFSAGGTEGVNANTTGLAGWALADAGETTAATKAATWLRGVQVADIAPCITTLTADNGAFAFNRDALDASRGEGSITTPKRDQFRRATAQALPALANVPAATGPLAISGPAKAVEKSAVTLTVSGLGGGETGCVTFGGVAKAVTGTGSDVTVSFDLPAGAATHTFAVSTLDATVVSTSLTATVPALTPTPVPTTPVPTTPVVPVASVGDLNMKKVVKVAKNKFRLRVACEGTSACEGTIRVRTAGKVALGAKKKARKVVVATKSYAVAAGTTQAVVLKVRKPARKLLAKKRIKVKAVAAAPGAPRDSATFWLKLK